LAAGMAIFEKFSEKVVACRARAVLFSPFTLLPKVLSQRLRAAASFYPASTRFTRRAGFLSLAAAGNRLPELAIAQPVHTAHV
jgi:hypothetical protein